jgi:CBS domain-containing protein
LVGGVVLGLLITKALVWSISLGSGASGGVFAPLFIIGGALGALAAPLLPFGDIGLWVLIGMAATLCGALRSPFGTTIFALEVTRDLNALPAVLIGCLAAEVVTLLLMRRSIVTKKMAQRGFHVAYDYGVDPLDAVRVGDVMDNTPPTILATMPVSELAELIARGDTPLARRQGTPIVDSRGALVGIITRGDVLRALEAPDSDAQTVLAAGSSQLTVAYPDETLRQAVERMLHHGVGRLPVVARDNPRHLVGYLGRTGIIESRLKLIQAENLREHSWSLGTGEQP